MLDSQFDDMNSGAHRRPATKIAAPAIAWQQNFWKPLTTSKVGTTGYSEQDSAWWSSIDALLYHMYRYLKFKSNLQKDSNFKCHNETESDIYLFRNKVCLTGSERAKLVNLSHGERSLRHDIFSLRTKIDGIVFILSARLHFEYFEFLICVELPLEREWGALKDDLLTINEEFKYLHEFAKERFEEINLNPDFPKIVDLKKTTNGNNITSLFKKWTREIISSAYETSNLIDKNKSFDPTIFNSSAKLSSAIELEPNKSCGGQFVDIIGIIFDLRYADNKLLSLASAASPKKTKGAYRSIENRTSGSDFNNKRNLRIVDAMLPISLSFNSQSNQEQFGNPEFTASLFQDDSVIYMSSLGRLASLRPDPEPVVYTLVVSHSNEWRLGRLIDRLHSLGSLRIASLRDITLLTESSDKIDFLSEKLKNYRTHNMLNENDAANHVNDISELFNKIEKFNLADKSGKDLTIDLTFRIDKSRHYVAEFKNILRVMQTKKIVGFQTYDNFVKRRVYDTFDFIDNIGHRYEKLRDQINFELNQNNRRELGSLYIKIAEDAKSSRNLLSTAEFISIVPLTYYLGGILSHIFKFSSIDSNNYIAIYSLSFFISSVFMLMIHSFLKE